jgi:hypothetical protein
VWTTGGPGALLVSPFNVKWRFSELAGGVEWSMLCLFSVIMPAKCVSSVSPRFHYRRLAFCFLPLVANLESSGKHLKDKLLSTPKTCFCSLFRYSSEEEQKPNFLYLSNRGYVYG